MARQTGVYFVGRMGNVVGSTWKGIPYFRFQPDNINQTAGTKQSADNMGKASTLGAAFRKMLLPVLPNAKDREMQNAFTGAIKMWLQTNPFQQRLPNVVLPHIAGFEFNKSSAFLQRCKVPIILKQNAQQQLVLKVSEFVPKQAITAPAYTKQIELKIIAACCNTRTATAINSFETAIAITYNDDLIPAQEFILPFTAPANSLTLVAGALQYTAGAINNTKTVTDMRWLPCGICSGWVK